MEAVFWISVVAVIYVYLGHPFVLWLLAKVRPKSWKTGNFSGSVTVYVPAYNEQDAIEKKIHLLLAQETDASVEILVANDGSSDLTAEKVRGFSHEPKVRLFDSLENKGKARLQNEIVPALDSDIVIFTDATAELKPDAIEKITRHFADPSVGAVAVDINFLKMTGGQVESGQRGYWLYERFLRINGARVWTNVSASGACYAIRRELFDGVPDDVSEDFINPFKVAFSGHRVIFDSECVVNEISTATNAEEVRMRKRVALRGITAVARYWRHLDPRNGFAAYQFFVNKLCRFYCWVPMILALVINVGLAVESEFYRILLVPHLTFYALALAGLLAAKSSAIPKVFFYPYFFLLLNFTYVIAFVQFLRGARTAKWETERNAGPSK